MRAVGFAFAPFVFLASPSTALAADAVKECIKTSDEAQLARAAHKYVSARDGFGRCAVDTCPAVVRKACAEWLDELEPKIPTLAVTAENATGDDLADAKITIDDRPAQVGRAVSLDPGSHAVRVTMPGFVANESTIVASEGARRTLRIRLERERIAPLEPIAASAERPSSEVRPTTFTWITGGLAVAATASFAFFAISGKSGASDLRERCAPSCSTSERDDVKTKYLVADVSLALAVVLGGVSIGSLFLGSPPARATAKRSAR